MRSSVAESVTRRGYWIGVATLTLVQVGLAVWAGLYDVEPPAGDEGGPAVESSDPMLLLMYSPLGMAVVLGVLQFLAANVLFWLGAWVWLVWRRGRGSPAK